MSTLLTDLRYAGRALLARRSFALAAVLTLAIGIGMTTAVFSFLDAVVLRPLALRDAGRLVTLCEQYPGATPDWCSIAPPNVMDIRSRATAFEALGMGRSWPFTLTTTEGRENLRGGLASDEMFEALGIVAAQGRLIEHGDLLGRPGRVAVISHATWQARFGGLPDVVGRSITLDGEPVTIAGILEQDAAVPLFENVEIWRPLHIDPRDEAHREWRGFVAYGKLRPGVPLRAARSELAGITRDLRATHFATTASWDINALSLHDRMVGDVRKPMMLFFGAVSMVLLIACANVANLMLARGASRGRELAVRSAVGASRSRIARALFIESLLLAVMGAALGVAISEWGVPAFKALAPAGIRRLDQVRTSGTVLAFTALVAIAASLLFGLLPALRASRVDFAQALREGGRAGRGPSRMGRLLVVAEVAIALPLVISAMLLARSFTAQMQWQPGFEREHLLTFSLSLPSDAVATRADMVPILERLEREIRGVPGVSAAGTASGGPLFGGRETSEMQVEGMPHDQRQSIRWYDVSPGFFKSLGVPIVRGTDFDPADVFGAPAAGLVNETLANRFWPGQNPVGKHLAFGTGAEIQTYTVRGVVRDIPPIRPGMPVEPQLYWSNRQAPRPFTYFVVRTTIPPADVAPAIRQRLAAVNRDFAPGQFMSMSQRLEDELRVPRFGMTLVSVFGVAALVLAGIGTYGLLAYFVEQQRREIGIQLALGAERARVLRGVVHRGLALAVPGAVAGILGSLALARVLRGFVAGVSTVDPVSILSGAAIVLGVAVAACLVPAWRASRIDPAVTLISE